MNHFSRILSLFFIVLILNACGDTDKKKDDGSLLNKAPYAGLTDSIQRFPNDPLVYFKRAELLSQNDQHELANADYTKSWDLKKDETTGQSFVSNLLLTGKAKEGVRLLQECIQLFPENPEFKRRLSEAYTQAGYSSDALQQYDDMLATDSMNFEAWYEKGMLLTQMKDTLGAIAALEKSYRIQPLQVSGLTLANLYAETKNPKVLPLCDEMLVKDTAKELTDAVFLKGLYYANIDQHAHALEIFEECIARDWKFTEAYVEKGIILFEQKNIDEALKTFALAAKVTNTYADAYFWMGRCYETIGKKDDALDHYYRALALDKNFTEARERIKALRK